MPKSAEELLIEISAASRRTRDAALLALLGDLKEFLESPPPAHQEQALLEPREGRPPQADKPPDRERQLRRNAYQRDLMRKRRAKQKEIKLAILNSTSNRPGTSANAAGSGEGCRQTDQAPWEDE